MAAFAVLGIPLQVNTWTSHTFMCSPNQLGAMLGLIKAKFPYVDKEPTLVAHSVKKTEKRRYYLQQLVKL